MKEIIVQLANYIKSLLRYDKYILYWWYYYACICEYNKNWSSVLCFITLVRSLNAACGTTLFLSMTIEKNRMTYKWHYHSHTLYLLILSIGLCSLVSMVFGYISHCYTYLCEKFLQECPYNIFYVLETHKLP